MQNVVDLVISCLFTVYWTARLLKAVVVVYTTLIDLQLALVEVDDVRVAVGQQTLRTPLTADTTFLVAGENAVDTVSIFSEEMVEESTYA